MAIRAIALWRIKRAHHGDRRKAAENEALGVEWNFTQNLQALVLEHCDFGGIERRLVGPHLPVEHDLLAAEAGVFAAGEVIPQDSTVSVQPYSFAAPFSAICDGPRAFTRVPRDVLGEAPCDVLRR